MDVTTLPNCFCLVLLLMTTSTGFCAGPCLLECFSSRDSLTVFTAVNRRITIWCSSVSKVRFGCPKLLAFRHEDS